MLKAQYVYALAVIIQHNEGMLRIYRQPHPCTNLFTLHCACMYGGLGRNEGIRCSSDVNEMGSSHGEHFRKNMKDGESKICHKQCSSAGTANTFRKITLLAFQCASPIVFCFRSEVCF